MNDSMAIAEIPTRRLHTCAPVVFDELCRRLWPESGGGSFIPHPRWLIIIMSLPFRRAFGINHPVSLNLEKWVGLAATGQLARGFLEENQAQTGGAHHGFGPALSA